MAAAQVQSDDASRRNVKVFVQRDYSRGTACRFQNKFPPELEGKLERSQFEQTVNHINGIFDEAERVGPRTYLEGCLGCVMAYLIFMCMQTQYNKCLKRLAEYINEQNQSVFVPRGLMITNPMDRGLRVIEIVVVNPLDQRYFETHCLISNREGLGTITGLLIHIVIKRRPSFAKSPSLV